MTDSLKNSSGPAGRDDRVFCPADGEEVLKAWCIDLQTNGWEDILHHIPLACRRCATGRRVLEEHRMDTIKKDEKKEVILCKEEGCDNPAMMNSRTGKPVNGRCGACHGEILRQGRQKGKTKKVTKTTEKPSKKKNRKGGGKDLDLDVLRALIKKYGLVDDLVDVAEKQVRSPEGQIVWYIKRGLDVHRVKKDKKGVSDAAE